MTESVSQQCFDQQVSQGVTNVRYWELGTAEPAEPNINHLLLIKISFVTSDKFMNKFMKKKTFAVLPVENRQEPLNWDRSHG